MQISRIHSIKFSKWELASLLRELGYDIPEEDGGFVPRISIDDTKHYICLEWTEEPK